jgi:hypothetical protein
MKSKARATALLAAFATVFLAGAAPSARAAELVAYLSANCSYCRAWEIEIGRTYGKTSEGREAPLRRIDASARRPGLEAVRYTPTFVLMDGDREIGRIEGYSGARFFWAKLDNLLAKLHLKPLPSL